MGGFTKIIITGLLAFTQATQAQGLRPAARDGGGMIPSSGPGIPTGSQIMSYESIQRMHTEQRQLYIQQRDNAYRAQMAASQPAPVAQSGMDPSMLALLMNLFKGTNDNETPLREYTSEEIEELYQKKVITQTERDNILIGKATSFKLANGKRVKAVMIRPQVLTEDVRRQYNSEPRPELCQSSGVKSAGMAVDGVTLPCDAIKNSLDLINACEGSFPNKNFIVVNDYSRLAGQKSFRSWLIPIARDKITGKFVVSDNTDVATGEKIKPKWYPLSNGIMRNDGHFCTKEGQNQTPAGYHLSNYDYHRGELTIPCKSGIDCGLPGVPSGLSPKIGMVGIEPDHNTSSLNRGILMHTNSYAGSPGASSQGCSVVTAQGIKELWKTVGGSNGGALINNYLGADAKSKVCGRDKENVGKFDQKSPEQKCAAIKLAASKQGGTNKLIARMNSSPTPIRKEVDSAPAARTPAADAPPSPSASLTKPRPDAKTR